MKKHMMALAALSMTVAPITVGFAPVAHALDAPPNNPVVSIVNGKFDQTHAGIVSIRVSWTVPEGTVSGDTEEIQLNNYYGLSSNASNEIKDQDGVVIGTLESLGNGKYLVTYNENVNRNGGTMRVDAYVGTIPQGDLGATIDGVQATVEASAFTPFENLYNIPEYGGLSVTQINMGKTGNNSAISFIYSVSSPVITKEMIGKGFEWKTTIDPKTRPYLTNVCSGSSRISITSSLGGLAGYDRETFSSTCTETEIIIKGTLVEESEAGIKTEGAVLSFDSVDGGTHIPHTTPLAQSEQFAGEYVIHNSFSVDGEEVSNYVFSFSDYGVDNAYVTQPVANSDTVKTPYGTPVRIDVLTNDKNAYYTVADSDTTIDATSVFILSNGEKVKTLTNSDGTYTVDSTGIIQFTPAKGFTGDAAPVSYEFSNTKGTISTTGEINITVEAAIPPKAQNDAVNVDFGKTTIIDVLNNDDFGNNANTVSKVELKDSDGNYVKTITTPAGTFTVTDQNTVEYTPAKGYSGTIDPIVYRVTDSNDLTSEATIAITVATASQPTVNNDTASTQEGSSTTINVLDNDVLTQEGATWDKVVLIDPATQERTDKITVDSGEFIVNEDNTITFVPKDGFSGEIPAITYVAIDSNGQEGTGSIVVNVNGFLSPVAKPDNVQTEYGKSTVINVLDNDELTQTGATWKDVKLIDPVTSERVYTVTTPAGVFTVNADHTITFTPAEGYSGTTPEISYVAIDSNGKESQSTISVNVAAEEKAPVDPTPTPTPTPTEEQENTPEKETNPKTPETTDVEKEVTVITDTDKTENTTTVVKDKSESPKSSDSVLIKTGETVDNNSLLGMILMSMGTLGAALLGRRKK